MLQGNSWLTKGLFKSQPQKVTKSQGQKMCGKSFLLLFFLCWPQTELFYILYQPFLQYIHLIAPTHHEDELT